MFLKKFIYVNWGNIPATEFEFGPINLLSGGNGSGKTTAADAIQTIMTAAHDTLFHFNPGQDEATQRGRGKNVRTLASYVLGCDDGSYARPNGAIGYLGAVFHPTKGETGEAFTAVIGVSASIDRAGAQAVARQNDLQFYIVAGEQLCEADFMTELDSKQRHVVELSKLKTHLAKRVDGNNIERYDTKKQYLRRLYGALRGRDDAVSEREAMNAAKTFSRFMAYKPVKSISGFVANEILEQKDLGDAIRTVSDLMKTIHAMENDANALAENIETLNNAKASAQTYIEHWIDYNVLEYSVAKARFMADQTAYKHAKSEQQRVRGELSDTEQEREQAQQKRKHVREQLIGMEAKRRGIGALQGKDSAEQAIEEGKNQLQRLAVPLLEQDHMMQSTLRACELIQGALARTSLGLDIPALGQVSLKRVLNDVLALKKQGGIQFHTLLGKDWVDLSPLESHLEQARAMQNTLNHWRDLFYHQDEKQPSLRDLIAKQADRREQKVQQLQTRLSQKRADIDSLESRQLNYPYFVRQALEAIMRECPQAEPRVLADYVEIDDSAWQNAIEGYIGGARFSILVDSEFEAEAARIVRAISGGSRARVIQGEKAKSDAQKFRLSNRSIIHLMSFEHATARAYLQASFGSVEQVDDIQTLRSTRRGVTQEGLGSGSYSIYRCDVDDTELVFGAGARDRALAAKRCELDQLQQQVQEAYEYAQQVQQCLDAVDLLRPCSIADDIQRMLDVHYQIEQAEQALTTMDLSDFSDMEHAFTALKDSADELDSHIKELDGRLGRLQQQSHDHERLCKQLSDEQEKTAQIAEDKEDNLRSIVTLWPDFQVDARLEQADQEATSSPADALEHQRQGLAQTINSCAYDIERHLSDHNLRCQTLDAIVYTPDYRLEHNADFFKCVCNVEREIERVYNRLKNNILIEKQDKIGQLRESFNNAFLTNLCHSIYQAINDGKRILEELNKELKHHQFGADREHYWFDWQWLPEYKEYWQFFDEIIKHPTLGDGATLFDADLSANAKRVRDHIMAMLLDEDEQKAMRELERISDYRNYRAYEIYKQPLNKEPIALSQYGTGSGGQLETPAYIIRSAAITSAFRFGEGDTHLRMVLVDEAFSKMDETRSKEVIQYLTESLGLQLLFIMPTSKSGPFMDRISNQFVFSKVPLAGGAQKGELKTKVLVDRQKCNQDKVQALWANHRQAIRHQAALDFMAEFE